MTDFHITHLTARLPDDIKNRHWLIVGSGETFNSKVAETMIKKAAIMFAGLIVFFTSLWVSCYFCNNFPPNHWALFPTWASGVIGCSGGIVIFFYPLLK